MNTKELETKLTEAQNKVADWAAGNLTTQQAKELFPLIAETVRIQSQISVEVALDTVFQRLKGTVVNSNIQKLDTFSDNAITSVRDNSH